MVRFLFHFIWFISQSFCRNSSLLCILAGAETDCFQDQGVRLSPGGGPRDVRAASVLSQHKINLTKKKFSANYSLFMRLVFHWLSIFKQGLTVTGMNAQAGTGRMCRYGRGQFHISKHRKYIMSYFFS